MADLTDTPEALTLDDRFNAPKQVRSQETLDRFLDAIDGLLAEHEFDDITVADIVARADRTVGAFYGRFADKDAALLAVAERSWERDRAYLEAFLDPGEWADASLVDVLRAGTATMLAIYRQPRLPRKSSVSKSAEDPAFADLRRRIFDDLLQLCQRVLLAKGDEITHPDPVRATAAVLRHLTVVCDHLLLYGAFFTADHVPDDVLVEDLVDVQLRMLTGRGVDR